MYNKKALKINLSQFTKSNPYKGDIINDPRGQWAHPGQNTRIPGSEITMNNVPYPVWAQPNVGPGMMMYPEQQYSFPNADYVDEFPQMQSGGISPVPQLDITLLQTALSQVASKDAAGINGTPDANITSFNQIYPEIRYAVQERYNALIQEQATTNTSMAPKMQSGGQFNQAAYDDSLSLYSAGNYLSDKLNEIAASPKNGAYEEFFNNHVAPYANAHNINDVFERLTTLNNASPKPSNVIERKLKSMQGIEGTARAMQFEKPMDKPYLEYNYTPTSDEGVLIAPIKEPTRPPLPPLPSLQTRPAQQLPQQIIPKELQQISKEDTVGKIKTPQDATLWKKTPSGTSYPVQRPIKPEYLESRKVGFLQDGGEYEELELSDEEIQQYRDGGYVVEEYPHGGEHNAQPNVWHQDNMDPSGNGINLDILDINRKLSPDLRDRVPYQYLQDAYFWEQEQRNKSNVREGDLIQSRDGGQIMELTDDEIQQYKDGGYIVEDLPKAQNKLQNGAEVSPLEGDMISNVLMNRNKNLNFVDRAYNPQNYPDIQTNTLSGYEDVDPSERSTHLMQWGEDDTGQASMYPSLVYNDVTKQLEPSEGVPQEFINVPNQYADYISSQGYKNATGMQSGGPVTTADSLNLYNNSVKIKSFYDKNSKYYEKPKITSGWHFDNDFMKKIESQTLGNPDLSYDNTRIIQGNKDKNISYMSDMITPMIDPAAPLLRYDDRIKPQGSIHYTPKDYFSKKNLTSSEAKLNKLFESKLDYYNSYALHSDNEKREIKSKAMKYAKSKGFSENDVKALLYKKKLKEEQRIKLPGNITNLPYYDPIQIKPWDMLTESEKNIRRGSSSGSDKNLSAPSSSSTRTLVRTSEPSIPKPAPKPLVPELPTRPLQGIPQEIIPRELIQRPKENMTGKVKTPQDAAQWIKNPQTGTWYQKQRPVRPEYLESRRVGFLQRGGRTPIPVTDPNDPRLQGYQDSLALHDFTKAQHAFEGSYPSIFNPVGYAMAERDPRHHTLQLKADSLVKNNPRINWLNNRSAGPKYQYKVTGKEDWFIPGKGRKKGDVIENIPPGSKMYEQLSTEEKKNLRPYIDAASPDIAHKTIEPTDWYMGRGANDLYDKPVQPYHYREPVPIASTAAASHVVPKPVKKTTTDPKMSVAVNLRKRGLDSSFAARKKMAEEAGIKNYKGNAEQNIKLNEYVFANYEGKDKIDPNIVVEEQPVVEQPVTVTPAERAKIPSPITTQGLVEPTAQQPIVLPGQQEQWLRTPNGTPYPVQRRDQGPQYNIHTGGYQQRQDGGVHTKKPIGRNAGKSAEPTTTGYDAQTNAWNAWIKMNPMGSKGNPYGITFHQFVNEHFSNIKKTTPEDYVFQGGGEFIEMELTPTEIRQYKKNGYIIEEV